MKKVAVLALSLSFVSSLAFAQDAEIDCTNAEAALANAEVCKIPPTGAPEVIIAGGASGALLGGLGLLLLAGLGGGGGGSSSSSSTTGTSN